MRLIPVLFLGWLLCVGGAAGQEDTSPVLADTPPPDAAAVLDMSMPIRSMYLYNGVDRPMIIDIAGPRMPGRLRLVVLDERGNMLNDPVDVRPGRLDLSEVVPGIWSLRRTAYLQLLDRAEPVGAALVLQPMLSRFVPQTRPASRPGTDQTFTQIIGWQDEAIESPPPSEERASREDAEDPDAGAEAATTEPGTGETAGTEPEAGAPVSPPLITLPPPVPGRDTSVFAGLRAYPEREVVMYTSEGGIVLTMCPESAPNTVWNFLRLCEGGFYRDVVFHRVVPLTQAGDPFVIQAGDPTGTGEGGPGWWLPIEAGDLPHDYGVISMARADDPDSAGSQFFICLSRAGTARLDGQYCAFGFATKGRETIDRIATTELADVAAGRPVQPPAIWETELRAAPPRAIGADGWMRRVNPEADDADRPQRPSRVPR